MDNVHFIVGSLVVLVYLVVTVLNVVQAVRNVDMPWVRMVSRVGAVLLLVQYALGFNLLAGERTITASHYIVALAALITVGFEHSRAAQEENPVNRRKMLALATLGTLILTLIAYGIGESQG